MAVTVLDRGPENGAATPVAAGMLAPFAEAQPEDPFLGFCVRARDFYHDLVHAVQNETEIDVGLWNEGILQVAFEEEDVTELKSSIAWQRQSGFTVEWLTPDDIRSIAPGIGPDALGAAFAPEDGALDPLALRDALEASATTVHGATLVQEHAEQLVFDGERVRGVRTASGMHEAGAVVIAAGSWSPRIRGVPSPLPVEPVRGQLAVLDWPAGEPPAVVYGGSGYVVARGGVALAGATMERVGFDTSTTQEGLVKVLRTANRLYPALDGAAIKQSWAGLRPVTPDGRPIIGRDPTVENLWYATGHGRNGILLAGMTGDMLVQLYCQDEPDYDTSLVAPERFRPA
jgi:glycine oxidase ThiO